MTRASRRCRHCVLASRRATSGPGRSDRRGSDRLLQRIDGDARGIWYSMQGILAMIFEWALMELGLGLAAYFVPESAGAGRSIPESHRAGHCGRRHHLPAAQVRRTRGPPAARREAMLGADGRATRLSAYLRVTGVRAGRSSSLTFPDRPSGLDPPAHPTRTVTFSSPGRRSWPGTGATRTRRRPIKSG